MKVKTSVSISTEVLKAVKKIAKKDDRSVSYVLEKFIEQKVKELPGDAAEERAAAAKKVLPLGKRKLSYSKDERRKRRAQK